MTAGTKWRALLIIGAVISLCVSDNVGPRLLPLPAVTEQASEADPSGRGRAASRAPSRHRTEGGRVEMVSATQSRAGDARQSPQAAPHAPRFELATPPAPRSSGREPYPPSDQSSAPFSRPKGRAPPRLV
jgi:hypothetical protein